MAAIADDSEVLADISVTDSNKADQVPAPFTGRTSIVGILTRLWRSWPSKSE